ncbi:hypothetical protein [Thioalkalivibrio halophilus]|uniref:hypothetical protein n=1 Tax=Thioalkalivibrio halophilus TaxID=252474 RepID=UPI001FCC45E9|nr:hypothetical protein [Thioalkalivibrio halophilus]
MSRTTYAASSADERARLRSLAGGVTGALEALVTSDGVLHDPCADRSTPTDHYGAVLAALALTHHDRNETAHVLLRQWSALPAAQRGHEPFNRLGLGLLAGTLEQTTESDRVAAARTQCPLARGYPSNNWSLLAQALRVREASPDRLPREQHRLRSQVRAWTTRAGGFIDFPRHPDPQRGIATPVAYHLKFLLCLHLALGRAPDAELETALMRGLDWLGLFLTDSGYCGGLGRSNHALFGDACLLTVLHGLLLRPGALRPDTATEVLQVARNLRQRLERQQRDDGLLWLTPGGGCGEAAGWDGYMYLTVYNAWFAGLLSATLAGHPWLSGTGLPDWSPAWNPGPGVTEDAEAGLLRYRGARVDARISTRGQAVQGFGRAVADLRQAALCPFHVEVDGRPVVAPPVRMAASHLQDEPAVAGWTPMVESAGGLFGLTRLDVLSVEPTDSGVTLTGSGAPVRLTRAPERTTLDRLQATLDWRLFGGRLGRRQALRPATLADHRWQAQLTIDDQEATLHYRLQLQPTSADVPARWLNPHGIRRLAGDSEPSGDVHLSTLGPAECRADPPALWPAAGTTRKWQLRLTPSDAAASVFP